MMLYIIILLFVSAQILTIFFFSISYFFSEVRWAVGGWLWWVVGGYVSEKIFSAIVQYRSDINDR